MRQRRLHPDILKTDPEIKTGVPLKQNNKGDVTQVNLGRILDPKDFICLHL